MLHVERHNFPIVHIISPYSSILLLNLKTHVVVDSLMWVWSRVFTAITEPAY
jgi:hypothetical protein